MLTYEEGCRRVDRVVSSYPSTVHGPASKVMMDLILDRATLEIALRNVENAPPKDAEDAEDLAATRELLLALLAEGVEDPPTVKQDNTPPPEPSRQERSGWFRWRGR